MVEIILERETCSVLTSIRFRNVTGRLASRSIIGGLRCQIGALEGLRHASHYLGLILEFARGLYDLFAVDCIGDYGNILYIRLSETYLPDNITIHGFLTNRNTSTLVIVIGFYGKTKTNLVPDRFTKYYIITLNEINSNRLQTIFMRA